MAKAIVPAQFSRESLADGTYCCVTLGRNCASPCAGGHSLNQCRFVTGQRMARCQDRASLLLFAL